MREKGITLEHHPHVALLGGRLVHEFAADPDLPRVRFQVPGDTAKDGGLAGSA